MMSSPFVADSWYITLASAECTLWGSCWITKCLPSSVRITLVVALDLGTSTAAAAATPAAAAADVAEAAEAAHADEEELLGPNLIGDRNADDAAARGDDKDARRLLFRREPTRTAMRRDGDAFSEGGDSVSGDAAIGDGVSREGVPFRDDDCPLSSRVMRGMGGGRRRAVLRCGHVIARCVGAAAGTAGMKEGGKGSSREGKGASYRITQNHHEFLLPLEVGCAVLIVSLPSSMEDVRV
jgi:hypothetical protein